MNCTADADNPIDGKVLEYDAWNRLRKVNNQSAALVAEFTYNGLGHRTGWLSDTTGNGTVDGSDDWLYFAYDDRWRIAATFWEGADPDEPYEQFTYHNAGLDGRGGSSYIDAVVLRDRDQNASEDGVLEERVYICQNWRADVSALLTDAGIVIGWAKFSAYGVPHGLPGGDTDSDGDYDGTDATAITGGGGYDVRKDVNLDGSVDIFDATDASNIHGGTLTLGRNVMTSAAMAVRKGYAGYELDPSLWGNATKGRTFWHVRHRVLDSGLGRWVQRDPAGYVDGMGLYAYAASRPVVGTDPMGLDMTIGGPCTGTCQPTLIEPPFTRCPPGTRYDPITNGCIFEFQPSPGIPVPGTCRDQFRRWLSAQNPPVHPECVGDAWDAFSSCCEQSGGNGSGCFDVAMAAVFVCGFGTGPMPPNAVACGAACLAMKAADDFQCTVIYSNCIITCNPMQWWNVERCYNNCQNLQNACYAKAFRDYIWCLQQCRTLFPPAVPGLPVAVGPVRTSPHVTHQ